VLQNNRTFGNGYAEEDHQIGRRRPGAGTSRLLAHAADISLLNVSYDPTRELYADYNKAFAKYWKEKSGDNVTIKASHGGPASRAVR
jgi:ABC-type sulfate transport system substrate-binding protein